MIMSSNTQLSNNCEIITVTNFDEIEAIRPTWEQMQREEPNPIPNADIERYLSVIKTSGRDVQPYIMVMRRDGCPVAITIGRIEKRRLNFKLGYKVFLNPALKCLTIVYGGIIGQPSTELCEVLVNKIMNVLRSGRADLVYFNHLGTDSPVYKLCKTVPGFFCRSHFASPESHWQTYIPDSIEEFYSRVPNSRKRRWRRDIRQLEKMSSSGIKVVCYRKPDDVNYLIDLACRIEKLSYKRGFDIGFTDSPVNRALLEKAAIDGQLRAYVLLVDGEPCAFQFDVRYGKTQFTEFGSFDPKWSHGSPGMVLMIKVLEQLCHGSDVSIMDYGFGDALYKSKFGTNHWLEEIVYIYAPRLRPILINMAMTVNLACCVFLNGFAKRLNMDSWVKRYWRKVVRKDGHKSSVQRKENVEFLS
jgi:CelD/BcsL family acetyltransferase involved in cellulose biosynthesis